MIHRLKLYSKAIFIPNSCDCWIEGSDWNRFDAQKLAGELFFGSFARRVQWLADGEAPLLCELSVYIRPEHASKLVERAVFDAGRPCV